MNMDEAERQTGRNLGISYKTILEYSCSIHVYVTIMLSCFQF